jgi:hypothetical protein
MGAALTILFEPMDHQVIQTSFATPFWSNQNAFPFRPVCGASITTHVRAHSMVVIVVTPVLEQRKVHRSMESKWLSLYHQLYQRYFW